MSDREQAFHLLSNWELRDRRPDLEPDWPELGGLGRELVWSCLRHQSLLDAWTNHLSQNPPSPRLRPFFRIGLCQILLLDGVADHAAVNETVETAKRDGRPRSQINFMNAVLRRALREHDELLAWAEKQTPAIRWSHPPRLVESWEARFGEQAAHAVLNWNQHRSRTFARLTPRGQEAGVTADLPEGVEPVEHFPDFYCLPRGLNPVDLPGFDRGGWYIQDPSTSMATALLKVQPGERVLDACAAPGGKSALLAEALGNRGDGLTAADADPKRLTRLRENLTRLGHTAVQIRTADGTDPSPDTYDAILLDVPCSNTGVLQRRPDAKWQISRKQLGSLAGLQYRLLARAAMQTNPGGRIVYSTCSIEGEETRPLLDRWLAQHPDWSLDKDILLLPGEKNCDGAYAALLKRA